MKTLITAILLVIFCGVGALTQTVDEPSVHGALIKVGHAEATSAVPPANDHFINATVTNNSAVGFAAGTNVDATTEPGEPQHAGNLGGRSVWYRWTAPGNAGVTFTTRTFGTNFNTLLAVYVGVSVNTVGLIAANDNYGVGGPSSVTFPAVAGVTYHIAVDGQN